jgi:hypothetical protein
MYCHSKKPRWQFMKRKRKFLNASYVQIKYFSFGF